MTYQDFEIDNAAEGARAIWFSNPVLARDMTRQAYRMQSENCRENASIEQRLLSRIDNEIRCLEAGHEYFPSPFPLEDQLTYLRTIRVGCEAEAIRWEDLSADFARMSKLDRPPPA
jgi:hypothetical protein